MYFIIDAPNIEALLTKVNSSQEIVSGLSEDELFESLDELLMYVEDIVECDHELAADGQRIYFVQDQTIKANFRIYRWLDRVQVSAILDSDIEPQWMLY